MRRGLLVLFVAALGCGEMPPPPPLPAPEARHPEPTRRIDLVERLPVALKQPVGPRRGPGPLVRQQPDGTVAQRAGSRLAYYQRLPEGARLRARATVAPTATAGSPPGAHVRLELLDAQGEARSRVLPLAGPGAAELVVDWDLGAHAGRFARLHLAFETDDPDARMRLVWHRLEIEGDAPAPSPAPAAVRRGRYDVLLVLFDSLRADRTGPYSGGDARTPAMDGLAARGVLLENAFSNASWTAPSVASMFTGFHPTVHRVVGYGAKGRGNARLPDDLPYLPEILRGHGYRTVAVFNNPMVSPVFDFERGFDRAEEYFRERERQVRTLPTPEARADAVWDRFVAPALDGEEPVFVYLHELDPHVPYAPPARFVRLHDPEVAWPLEPFDIHDLIRVSEGYRPDAEERRHAELLYRGEISFMDGYLRRILERLRESGRAERTLVVFTSDHGEELLEHGLYGHGYALYEEQVRIPLVWSLPGVLPEGRRERTAFQLHDVSPTLLDLLGIDAPDAMQGHSLLPWIAGDPTRRVTRPLFFRTLFADRVPVDAVRYGAWKLHRTNDGRGRFGGSFELFDLASDPDEARNLWTREPIVGHALRQLLEWRHHEDARIARGGPGTDGEMEVDDALREALETLGYLH